MPRKQVTMKKIFKRISIITSFVLLSAILFVLAFGKAGFAFAGYNEDGDDYSGIISLGVAGDNPRVVDIAMLGAHDAFSSRITKNSPVDPGEAEDSILRNKAAAFFADGLFARLAKSQRGDATDMLENGVRYLDVRLSNIDGTWFTKHALVSDELSYYLSDVITFLGDHSGEFIVFDLQHVYLGDATFDDLFTYLDTFEVNGKSLLDFVRFDPTTLALGDLRYDDVTLAGTESGVVILAKTENTATLHYHYERGEGDTEGSEIISIRSLWHNTSDSKKMLDGIHEEFDLLTESDEYDNVFRVNQAQKTGVISGPDLLDTLVGWSLVDMASYFNSRLVKQTDFITWFSAMPILMVDYAISNRGQFNTTANLAIIGYNQSLV